MTFEEIKGKQIRWLEAQKESFIHPECNGMSLEQMKEWRDRRAGFSMQELEREWRIAARAL